MLAVTYLADYGYSASGYVSANIDTAASDSGVVSQLDPNGCGRYEHGFVAVS